MNTVPPILHTFARLLGTEIHRSRLEIPEEFGTGYCAGFILNENIRLIISNYELKEEIPLQNPEIYPDQRVVFFKFQQIFASREKPVPLKKKEALPSVLIATSRINTEEIISIHSNTSTLNIEVRAEYLNGLFTHTAQSPVLHSLLQNTQPLLFEEIIYPSLQKIVQEIVTQQVGETFELFFLRVKSEELICSLFMELEKWKDSPLQALNMEDIKAVYRIKEKIIGSLGSPPLLADLANEACMSSTKLKRLFKQIFGHSIYTYYQRLRMEEAARLLKEENRSVSDVGYRMGFTNLSHFSRVFEAHIGMKPKKYSKSG